MHHFHYKGGVLHAEDVSIARLAAEVGTPFYCYSTATLDAALPRADRSLRGPERAHLLCGEGELQPGGAAHARRVSAPAWTSSPRASCGARSRPACRRRRSSSPASARRARRSRSRSTQDILGFNVESEPELRVLSEEAVRIGPHGAHRAARQPGRRRQDARQDLDRQGREQVRHPLLRRRRGSMREARTLPGIEVVRHPHAHRQPDHRAGAVPQRLPAVARAGAGADRATAMSSSTSTSAAASACPTCRRARWRRRPPPMPRVAKETLGDLGLKLVLEPGRVIVGNAGILVTRVLYAQGGRRQDVHRRRRRHERPDPADAVRGAARDLAGRAGQGGDAADGAGRGGAGVRDGRLSGARPASCRRWSRATSWR